MTSVSQIILFLPFSLVFFPTTPPFLLSSTLHTPSFLSLKFHPSVCGAFLDLCKAFDSVTHQPFIDIHASSNLPSPLLNWLHSYIHSESCTTCSGKWLLFLISSCVLWWSARLHHWSPPLPHLHQWSNGTFFLSTHPYYPICR